MRIIKHMILLLTFICYPAIAKQYTAYFGGRSIHYKGEAYNETHNLIAIGLKGVTIGTMKNSYKDQVYFAGYDLNQNTGHLTYGAVFGISHGYCGKNQKANSNTKYGCNTNKWLPLGVAYLSYSKFPIQPTIGITWNALVFTIRAEF
tara:strand:- start:93 stop:533 length:441 start_codon:yes stop_codon:yes gene_type:complete